MAVDEERIGEAVLALLWLTLHGGRWACKGVFIRRGPRCDVTDRLAPRPV